MLDKQIEEMESNSYNECYRKVPDGAIILTRAEMDALNEYAEKVRRETTKAIFADVAELLEARSRIEGDWASLCKDTEERRKFQYGSGVCASLLVDLQRIERKYNDEAD